MMKHLSSNFFLSVFILALTSCGSRNTTSNEVKPISFRIMTYNVHHCNPPDSSGVIDVDATANVIKKERPDIVALQEIDVNTGRSGHIDEAQQLAQKAGFDHYYFAKTMDFDGGQYGLAILSKFPLSDTSVHKLPSAGIDGGEPRVVALGTVQLPNGAKIRFGSTHLEAFHPDSRLMQINDIDSLARAATLPFVIAGDFNAAEKSDVIDILDKEFVRTCYECAATFDEEGTGDAIDYIAFRKTALFRVDAHEVIQDKTASDHMPVVAVLQFTGKEN